MLKQHFEFDMKDLVTVKKILDMEISHDRAGGDLLLFRMKHIKKIVAHFNIQSKKHVNTLLAKYLKLFDKLLQQIEEEEQYSITMYYVCHVCTNTDILQVVRAVSHYMKHIGKTH